MNQIFIQMCLRYLTTPTLIFSKTLHYKMDIQMFYQTVSIDLVEYQYSSVVKVSGLWTADHEFKSTSGFCSYLLQLKLNVLTIIVYFFAGFFAPPPNIINFNFLKLNTKNMVYIPWKTKIPQTSLEKFLDPPMRMHHT